MGTAANMWIEENLALAARRGKPRTLRSGITKAEREEYREALKICGTTSGRDHDKFAAAGITPAFTECGDPYVEQADLVLICKKLYVQDLEAGCFLDTELRDKAYAGDDYHRMYVGHIVEAYQNL